MVIYIYFSQRLKNANDVVDAFNVDPLYLKHDQQGQAPDYRVERQHNPDFNTIYGT